MILFMGLGWQLVVGGSFEALIIETCQILESSLAQNNQLKPISTVQVAF
jgi:hypothetical protein